MDDCQFLRSLEDCSLTPAEFSHKAHVRAGYLYLMRERDFAAALQKLRGAIEHFATFHGADGKYHETVTVAYLAAIHERLAEDGLDESSTWDDFSSRHPELFEKSFLLRYYSPETLSTPLARKVFVLEPRAGAPI